MIERGRGGGRDEGQLGVSGWGNYRGWAFGQNVGKKSEFLREVAIVIAVVFAVFVVVEVNCLQVNLLALIVYT